MPVTDASVQPGEGTLLMVKISAAYVKVAQVFEVDGPEWLVEAIDRTALDTGFILTRPSKFPEPGKISLKVWYDPNDTNTQAMFVTDATTPGAVQDYQLQVNDDNTTHATVGFSAFLTSFKITGVKPKSSNLEADIELQCTTLPVVTPGT